MASEAFSSLGDIEARAEAELLDRIPATELISLGHHGSNTSSSAAFLAALGPKAAFISCGLHNRFGFPHAAVLARLSAAKIDWYSTATHGPLLLQTDGPGWQLCRTQAASGRWGCAPLEPSNRSTLASVKSAQKPVP